MLLVGREDASQDGEGWFGPTSTDSSEIQTLLVTITVTIRGKVDTAETGVGGDF